MLLALPMLTEELETVGRNEDIDVAAPLVDTDVEEKELGGKIPETLVVDTVVV